MVAFAEPKTLSKPHMNPNSRSGSNSRTSKTPYPRSISVTSGQRFYSANLHTWINRDPMEESGGGINLCGFCNNDDINAWDFLGMTLSISDATMLYAVVNQTTKADTITVGTVVIGVDPSWNKYKEGSGTQSISPKQYVFTPLDGVGQNAAFEIDVKNAIEQECYCTAGVHSGGELDPRKHICTAQGYKDLPPVELKAKVTATFTFNKAKNQWVYSNLTLTEE